MSGLAVALSMLADFLTILIGAATIYGLIKYRKKISATFRILRLDHLAQRREEIQDTLKLIENVVIKGRSPDARALFGRLDGQLIALCDAFPEFKELQTQVSSIAHQDAALTEPIKQKLVYQISSNFDAFKLKSMDEIVGDKR